MKVCKNCCTVNEDDNETCLQCGGNGFDEDDLIPDFNSILAWREDEKDTE